MKSIKPGRGPSMMSGIVGIFMVGFGIVWTIFAAKASILFSLFGVFWTAIALIQTIYSFKNATSRNRYSAYDITEDNEEIDPLNERFGGNITSKYCPYCGKAIEDNYIYCNSCGKKLP